MPRGWRRSRKYSPNSRATPRLAQSRRQLPARKRQPCKSRHAAVALQAPIAPARRVRQPRAPQAHGRARRCAAPAPAHRRCAAAPRQPRGPARRAGSGRSHSPAWTPLKWLPIKSANSVSQQEISRRTGGAREPLGTGRRRNPPVLPHRAPRPRRIVASRATPWRSCAPSPAACSASRCASVLNWRQGRRRFRAAPFARNTVRAICARGSSRTRSFAAMLERFGGRISEVKARGEE